MGEVWGQWAGGSGQWAVGSKQHAVGYRQWVAGSGQWQVAGGCGGQRAVGRWAVGVEGRLTTARMSCIHCFMTRSRSGHASSWSDFLVTFLIRSSLVVRLRASLLTRLRIPNNPQHSSPPVPVSPGQRRSDLASHSVPR